MVVVGGGEGAKHILNDTVGAFGLPIRFRVVGGAEALPCAKRGCPRPRVVAVEDAASVGDDVVGLTVKADDVGGEEPTKLLGVKFLGGGDQVNHLGEAVHKDEDGVKAGEGDR